MTWLCLGAGIFWLDYFCKNAAEKFLKTKGRKEWKKTGFFLQLIHNKGFAFNRMEEHPGWVTLIQGILMAVIGGYSIFVLFLQKSQKMICLGLSMILGGGASNLFDRITRGYVVDYLGLPGIKKVVFNLSDLFIFLGSFFILVGSLQRK